MENPEMETKPRKVIHLCKENNKILHFIPRATQAYWSLCGHPRKLRAVLQPQGYWCGRHSSSHLSLFGCLYEQGRCSCVQGETLWIFSALSSQLQLTFSLLLFAHFLHLITSGLFVFFSPNWEDLLLSEVLLQTSYFCKYNEEGTRLKYNVHCY